MAIRKNQVRIAAFFAGLGLLGLAACMDDARQARFIPSTTPGYGLFFMDEGASASTMTLASEGRSSTLKTAADAGDGTTLVTASVHSDAGPLKGFRRTGRIDVTYAGANYGIVANPAERVGVERFFTACERAV